MAEEFHLQNSLFNRLVLPLLRCFAWVSFKLLGGVRVEGKSGVPRTGGLIILANHLSDIDPVVVQYACPRTIYFMAKSELFKVRVLGKVMSWFRAFPVERGTPDRGAIKFAIKGTEVGQTVCVFPEGRLSRTGETQPFLKGAGLIVKQSKVPVICCGLVGTPRLMPYGKVFPRFAGFGRVRVRWGEVRVFEGQSVDEIVDWAEAEVARLIQTK